MATSTFPMQEMWDEVLDCLANPQDFKSSALVCRAFVPRAQAHLFHTIHLRRGGKSPALLANRLQELLASSLHLIEYIRTLHIDVCDAETLAPLVSIPWSRVSTISFMHWIDGEDLEEEENFHPELRLDLIGELVSLPMLRQISFNCIGWKTDPLRRLLAKCSPTVCNLSVTHCLPLDTTSGPCDPSQNSRRPIITALSLLTVPGIPPFSWRPSIFHVSHTFNFTGTVLELWHYSMSPGTPSRAWISMGQVRSCAVLGTAPITAADHDVRSLDLGLFPELSHITLQNVGPALHQAIENSGTIHVRTISYLLPWIRGTDSVKQLETTILAAEMPMLRRVEVRIDALFCAPERMQGFDWVADVREKMPQLVNRGILDVTL
ncbi:hypothetical protein K438DRAFT_1970773 [Mycena galopus ATCC 62051]|nr:hypothetical protein K438DRAFT_1970773 [Mycena galopus ATCC 62051]